MKILMIICMLLVFGCTQPTSSPNRKFEIIETSELQFNITFPQKLWDKIFDSAPLTINIKKGAYEIFSPLVTEVEIVEEKGSALGSKNYKLTYEQFGGEIDWDDYLDRDQGGVLRVYFRFPYLEDTDKVEVYFLSSSQKMEVGNETFGNNCLRVLKLTSYYNKIIAPKGLLLHTKDLRYLYATAGRFYFLVYKKDKIQLSQVSFNDSKFDAGVLCSSKL